MREYLTFLLAGPMASFGGPAGRDRRGSAALPGRSAIIGLLGAALGVGREDRGDLAALALYEMAVASLRRSSALRDYHTVQTVPSAASPGARSRKDALADAGTAVHSLVTLRDYRCDVAIAVAVWGEGNWPLSGLAGALRRPAYTLCLGRRSCPPAFPLGPRIVKAPDPVAALVQVRPALLPDEPGGFEAEMEGEVLCWSEIPGVQAEDVTELHSCPADRENWTFRPEPVWVYRTPAAAGGSGPCS